METTDLSWWLLLALWTLSQIANQINHRAHMKMHDDYLEFLRQRIARMEAMTNDQ